MRADAKKYCLEVERARSDGQTLVHDRNYSWNLGLPSVCAGSCAGSKRNLWRGRIWNRSSVSCPPSEFNPAGREWASLLLLNSTRMKRLSITILVLLGVIIPIFMTVGYAIHLRYPCWPHHPIDFCS